ncbi:MAG: AMP-binding protein [Clostridia bacterium]|nr:AMP-binding protein [Clostridia bacterium]
MAKKPPFQYYDVVKIDTIKEMMELAVQSAGDKVAFKYREDGKIVDVTYSEFYADTMAIGTALASIGMADRHVAMLAENSYKWISVYLTMLQSPGVYVPIDKELPLVDILNIVNDSDSEVLFYSKRYEADLLVNVGKMPNIKYFIGLDREEDDGNFLSFKTFKEKGEKLLADGDTSYTRMTSDPYQMRLLVYTSGTTGMQKGVMLSEHNVVYCVYCGLQVSTVYNRSLSVLPYNHTYEAVAGLLVAIHKHLTVCINDSLKLVLKNLQEYKPDTVYLVPAFVEVFYKKIWANARQNGKEKALQALIKTSNAMRKVGIDMRRTMFASVHKAFGGNLRKIVCGGAPLRPELGEFFDAIGIALINGYGITECSPLVSANHDDFNDWNTVGIPIPCVQIKFDNMTPDGVGEICVKGDTVMLGYYKQPELTAECLKDGWFYTGDYGKFNDRGQLMITGRKKNLIVLSNGKNVFPEEIEGYIAAIPYISEVVVYAIKDEHGMEDALCAEVYIAPEKMEEFGVTDPVESLKTDIAKAVEFLPHYKRISKIKIRDTEFEKTTTNKIRRNKIVKD